MIPKRDVLAWIRIALVLLGVSIEPQAHAEQVCMTDLDGDGSFDATGEVNTCIADATATNYLCPTAATACTTPPPPAPTCPLGAYPCDATPSCTAPQTCNFVARIFSLYYYSCPSTGALIARTTNAAAATACAAACTQTAACTTPPPPAPTCPLDAALPCIDDGSGTQFCNTNACVDSVATATSDPISSNYLQNDAIDPATGNCTGTMMLFNGRPMECWKSGWLTLGQNCCADQGQVYKDSTGTLAEVSLAMDAIVGTYNVAATAYLAYTSTGSAVAAADAATTYMSFAIDPTTIAITVAVAVILDYAASVCADHGMETAMLKGSGYCHYINEHCVEKLLDKCIQKERTYCCFDSKLARIIQEQGRPQLKAFSTDMWVSPSNRNQPNCRGLYPDEFANLDFSQIDLSEYIGDLRHEAITNIQTDMQNATTDFTTRLP